MNKYKKLVNNSIVFTIGNFGSKMISLIMVPLYTHLLSTKEYGTVDLMNTTVSLLTPLVTLELGEAALRFAVEAKDEVQRNKIFSNISSHVLIVSLLVVILYPLVYYFNLFDNYGFLFAILLILRVANNLYSQYIRGIGLVKKFAMNGILMTLVTVITNVVLLVIFNFKVEGYIMSMIIATLASNFYLFFATSGIRRLKVFNPDLKLLKEMLRFSIPLIPNVSMWWIINSSTRYFILYFIGPDGNGIYAVANMIPSVILMVTGIFSQAWQLSSFEEYESESKDEFHNKTFSFYWCFLFICGSSILVILKPLLSILVEDSFYDSWRIVPALIFAVIYQSFGSFLGTNYAASKETKGAFSTSVYAGIVSLISSFILIPTIGIIGAGLSSAVSFFAMFVIRLKDTQKFVKLKIDIFSFILVNLVFILQVFFLFFLEGFILFIIELLLFIFLLLINKKVLVSIIKMLINALSQQKSK